MPLKPSFFPAPSDFRAWLEAHHDKFRELLVGFHKKSSGKPSITWPESVEVALCFGWIDGVRKSLDGTSYTIRFTPRKPSSTWSSININLVRNLTKQSLMYPAGLRLLPHAAKRNPASTPTSNERAPASVASRKSRFAPTSPLGNFSVPEPLGTKGCARIGSSLPKGKKQSSSGSPSSSAIRRIGARYRALHPRRRSNLAARHVE